MSPSWILLPTMRSERRMPLVLDDTTKSHDTWTAVTQYTCSIDAINSRSPTGRVAYLEQCEEFLETTLLGFFQLLTQVLHSAFILSTKTLVIFFPEKTKKDVIRSGKHAHLQSSG